jgi:hypothetical protein
MLFDFKGRKRKHETPSGLDGDNDYRASPGKIIIDLNNTTTVV